jgi:hypothetical protein
MSKYKLVASNYAGTPITVIDLEAGWCIPIDNDEYLEWLEEGNTPEAADVPPAPTWLEKRQTNIAGGGYGEITEQLEIIGEQGMTVFQDHIAAVKAAHPKP